MDAAQLKTWWRTRHSVPVGGARVTFAGDTAPAVPAAPTVLSRPGRAQLLAHLALPAGARVVELGGDAGAMLDLWGARLSALGELVLVGRTPALVARARAAALTHRNVTVAEADSADFHPDWLADCVCLPHALTMHPDWVRLLNNALALLRVGGVLAVTDYYLSSNEPGDDTTRRRHGLLARWFWTDWFRRDEVHLSPRHLDALCTVTQRRYLYEGTVALPGLPLPPLLLKAPYYVYIGVKTAWPLTELMKDLWKQSAQRTTSA